MKLTTLYNVEIRKGRELLRSREWISESELDEEIKWAQTQEALYSWWKIGENKPRNPVTFGYANGVL